MEQSRSEDNIAEVGVRNQTSKKVMAIINMALQIGQLTIFLGSFSFITHYIIHTELVDKKQNLKNFVLPAIISVFMWMMSISYFSLELVLNPTTEVTPLVFQDHARKQLHASLRKKLQVMEKRGGRVTTVRPVVKRPNAPPPPPPSRPVKGAKTDPRVSIPRLATKGKNQIEPQSLMSGPSVRTQIREIDEANLDKGGNNVDERSGENSRKTSSAVNNEEYLEGYWNNSSCLCRLFNFILETQ